MESGVRNHNRHTANMFNIDPGSCIWGDRVSVGESDKGCVKIGKHLSQDAP